MIFHQRYNAIAILSQASLGATYLAQDQGRFNEQCILKELNLSHLSDSDFAQARDRFLLVANQLYRLKHRQIPAFRATFCQGKRLFFVQDYIEGQSLEDIRQARQSQNRTLTETEVRELCQRLLPVLDYLHRQNLVSGNINPARIILHPTLATPNHLEPVFIGLDARWACLPPQQHPYSPPEQRQAYPLTPSSDLYSLAATAVVVLTGQNPETLYDSASETWDWQDEAEMSDDLAAVLNRMLQPDPRDRYACALDVLQALQPLPTPEIAEPTLVSPIAPVAPINGDSAAVYPEPRPAITNPVILVGITLSLGLVAGISAWALVEHLYQPTAVTSASPVAIPTPTPTPTPEPTPIPEPDFRERLTLPPGQILQQSGTLPPDTTAEYILRASANQQLAIALASEGIWFTLLKPNREIVELSAELVKDWQGTVSESGDYILQLISIPGLSAADYQYQLEIALSNSISPAPSPAVVETPVAVESPQSEETVVTLSPITEPVQMQGETSPQRRQSYRIPLEAGKTLEAQILSGRVTLNIYTPDGQPITAAQGVQYWQGRILRGGEYRIDAIANQPREFTLSLSYLDPESPLPSDLPVLESQ